MENIGVEPILTTFLNLAPISTIEITGNEGCSGAPLFKIENNKFTFAAMIFYALKDNSGKASLCKAIDIKWLQDWLKEK